MDTLGLSTLVSEAVGIDGRSEVSGVYGVLVGCSLMFDGRSADAILNLAADAVQSLSESYAEAVYRVVDGKPADHRDRDRPLDRSLDTAVSENLASDHAIELPDAAWRYAITLRTVKTVTAVLVVRSERAPSAREMILLKVLAQQTAAAMVTAELIDGKRRQSLSLQKTTADHERTIHRLSRSVAALERRDHIHEVLTRVSASGVGEAGIAGALHELTSLAVSVEDAFGNLLTWSPPPTPGSYRPVGGDNRADVLRQVRANGQHSRDGDRVFRLIRSKTHTLGVVALHDPHRRADRLDTFALEYAAAVLAVEMSYRRSLAEAELRLRRDLIDDLLAGTDDTSAYSRGAALGHNLRTPHRVTIVQWSPEIDGDLIARTASRWATAAGLHPLSARRPSMIILLTEDLPEPESLHRAISRDVGNGHGWIAIGSVAKTPSCLPRSFADARRTLRIQKVAADRYGSRRFDDLGVCRILDPGDNAPAVREFLSEWLGALMAYDDEKSAELVKTLGRYLDCGGNYDQAATALNIHRSTLRYRLGRIRDISGLDLQDVNSRLNLHLATKVYDMVGNPTVHHGGCPD